MPWILKTSTINTIRPVPARNTFDWIVRNVRTPDGKPFNPFDFPWTEGICKAWDHPAVRQLTLQFAARLGKTLLSNSLMISALEHDPAIGMIGLPTETLLREMIRDKYYRMLERCRKTRDLIPPEGDRTQLRIDLASAIVYGAWAGSPTSLADKAPKYKHGGEVDKWTKQRSDEADPLDLFLERGIEIPDRKTLVESTPSIEGASRVERHLLTGWNARFLVPCPKCKHFIELISGDEQAGIVFDKLPDGKADERLAKTTARYRCQLCRKEWGDEHRREVVQAGKWVPEGQSIDKRGRISGTMAGSFENASFQLSRIYAPTFTFGDIAGEIARCLNQPERWHNFNNSWMGRTYRRRRATKEWFEVGDRLVQPYQKGTVPAGGIFLTAGVDVQADHYVFVIAAWGHEAAGWVVDYGIANTEAELLSVLRGRFKHLDGGPNAAVHLSLIDAGEGARQDEIIDFCRRINHPKGPWVWPSKGSSGPITGGRTYRDSDLDELSTRRTKSKRKNVVGLKHIMVNTPFFQSWVQAALHYRLPNSPKSIALPQEAQKDEDFLRQLVNEKPEDSTDTTGHAITKWVVVDESCPWDFRDALRYARCAAEIFTRGAWQRVSKMRTISTQKPEAAQDPPPQPDRPRLEQEATKQPKNVKPSPSFIRQAVSRRFLKR
jgi:phage terminase large subunit GpA-like protein